MPDICEEVLVRKRTKGPKVKTGCVTCKIRRVKCDEAKPACMRCEKFGRRCDGYSQARTRSEIRKWSAPVSKVALPPLKPSVEPSFMLFETESEGRYYRLFVETTAWNLGGYYDLELWGRTILQTSTEVSSIRHVVIALAALDLSAVAVNTESRQSQALDRRKPGGDASSKHQFALQQYSMAIKEMREDISKTKQDLRTTLLATVLLVTFESYHGNYQTALQQFRSGQQVLQEWKAAHPNLPDDDFTSPCPQALENKILLAFNQLEMLVNLYSDSAPVEEHLRLKDSGASVVQELPEAFRTINEVVLYSTAIIRRCIHFTATAWVYDCNTPTAPSPNSSIMDRISGRATAEGYLEQARYVKELERWHDAFRPFFERSKTPGGQEDFAAATCVKIHYLVIYTAVVTQFATDETFYDEYLPLFTEIVALVKVMLETCQKSNFTTAFRVVLPLDWVGRKCRDPTIRREVIKLLMATPRRECLWDSVVVGKVLLWVMGIEEEGRIGDHVPEEARVRNIEMKHRPNESSIYVCCQQMKKGSEEMILREGLIAI